MSRPVEMRYRCALCAGPVTMEYRSFVATVNDVVFRLLRGEHTTDDEEDYVAFVCLRCQEDPDTGVKLARTSWPGD